MSYREKTREFELYPLTLLADAGAIPFVTKGVDVSEYPSGTVQIYNVGAAATFTADIEQSNIDVDTAYEKINTSDVTQATSKMVTFNGCKFIRVRFKTWTGAGSKLGARANAALQS